MALCHLRRRIAPLGAVLALALAAPPASAGLPLVVPLVWGCVVSVGLIGGAVGLRLRLHPGRPPGGPDANPGVEVGGEGADAQAGTDSGARRDPPARPDAQRQQLLPMGTASTDDRRMPDPGVRDPVTSHEPGASPEPTELRLTLEGHVDLRTLRARVGVAGPGEVRFERLWLRDQAGVEWRHDALDAGSTIPPCKPGSLVSRTTPCSVLLGLSRDAHVGAFAPVRVTAQHEGRQLDARGRVFIYKASFVSGVEERPIPGAWPGTDGMPVGAAMMLFDGRTFHLRAVPGIPGADWLLRLLLSKDGRQLYLHTRAAPGFRNQTLRRWNGMGTDLLKVSRDAFRVYPTRRGACAIDGADPYSDVRKFECFDPQRPSMGMHQEDQQGSALRASHGLDLLWIRSLHRFSYPAVVDHFSDHWVSVQLPAEHELHDLDPHDYAQTRSPDGVERHAFFGRFLDGQDRRYPAAMMHLLPRGVPGSERPRIERFEAFDFGTLRVPRDIRGTFIDGRGNTGLYMIAGDANPPPGTSTRRYLLQSAVFEPVEFALVRKSRAEWVRPPPDSRDEALTDMVGVTDDTQTTDYLVLMTAGEFFGTHAQLIRVDRMGGLAPQLSSEPLFLFPGKPRASRFVPMLSSVPYPA